MSGIAITGLGLVTSAGIGVEASWARILRGESTASPDANLAGQVTDFSCRVPDFDADAQLGRRTAWRQERCAHLARVAAREAIADSGLDPASWNGARVGVVVGNSLGGTMTFEQQYEILRLQGESQVTPMLIPMAGVGSPTAWLTLDLGARGPNLAPATACASGATALGVARDWLRSGICDVVIAGGAESALSPLIMAGFGQLGALSTRSDDPATASRPFDADRDGFVAAEGAGILVLERAEDAQARGARVHARLAGYGGSSDAHHITAPHPQGDGVERATLAALAEAGLTPGDIDHVNAHGTSTPMNDVIEGGLINRLYGDQTPVTSVKGTLGHALGAAGAIEAVCTVLSVRDGIIPPTANLDRQDPRIELDIVHKVPRQLDLRAAVSNSFGFGGANGVIVVTRV
ncbi:MULTISPECIES: beta-ketoacyl synthase [unclassified Crossiella]|uniref:beta-ketoacyl-[acyl-carrier-protein] synthase family protein n=1 Tax=unclassified Crossiella TaxID=2620835 RepID=UPI001FFE7BF0|nr:MULTISPECIES: beta-ketoacyl-[acyl-carrier-protein] synthase family protein [unclassified Crossiella]MCK2239826.1 beta-ketoacyl-[acyl-carrier-protein] synthase family protein [Crossiella sp. S99.2]MCK2252534.1 beta-ketoacyl-[acyl-carrier-protein] synthase family protein [Crossiella sp. S99.1]